jgi:hypothetical protein
MFSKQDRLEFPISQFYLNVTVILFRIFYSELFLEESLSRRESYRYSRGEGSDDRGCCSGG